MKYEHSTIELIRKRVSNRSYDEKKLEPQIRDRLTELAHEIAAEKSDRMRFVIIDKKAGPGKPPEKLGTYGMIKGANLYIVGIDHKVNCDPLRFGYAFEELILAATDLGLGTCWLGGTFRREDFEKKAGLREEESIFIVSPVGFPREKPRMLDHAFRGLIGADKRKPWSELFFQRDGVTPLSEADAAEYVVPLEMVRLGPSASNKQPWRIVQMDGAYHFFLARTKGYGIPGYDIQRNDIGIAMCHFELSARETGLAGHWETREDALELKGCEYIVSWITM